MMPASEARLAGSASRARAPRWPTMARAPPAIVSNHKRSAMPSSAVPDPQEGLGCPNTWWRIPTCFPPDLVTVLEDMADSLKEIAATLKRLENKAK
jgi:hypothetical protein